MTSVVPLLTELERDAKSPREVFEETGVRAHLVAESAEGIRAPKDRELAAQRAESARSHLADSTPRTNDDV